MRIACDTREQSVLSFELCQFLTGTERLTLSYGDYEAIYNDGERSKTVFERKSLPDLFGTMGKGYKRFKKELDRAKNDGRNLVVIVEATYSEVLDGFERSKIEGISIIKKMMTLEHRYGLRTIYCSNRKEMSHLIKHWFIAEGIERLKDERHQKVSS